MNKRNTFVGPQLQRGGTGFNPDWEKSIGFLAVIVLGSIVASQVLANSYRFHPALGFNLFHIYLPWSYFVWAHQWEQATNHALFAQAFGIGSLVTLGGFMLLLLDVARANSKVNPYLHGSARWADKRDIKAAGLLKNDGVYVGAWRDKNGKIQYLRHAGPEHVLCTRAICVCPWLNLKRLLTSNQACSFVGIRVVGSPLVESLRSLLWPRDL